MSHGGSITGEVVSSVQVASDLGFKSAEDMQKWFDEGGPTGECSNTRCGRPAFWPDLKSPCKVCGCEIKVDFSEFWLNKAKNKQKTGE